MTSRGRHPHKPKPRLSQKEAETIDADSLELVRIVEAERKTCHNSVDCLGCDLCHDHWNR